MNEEDTDKPEPESELSDEGKIKQLHDELEEIYKKGLQEHLSHLPPHFRRPLWYKLDENKKVVPCSLYEFSRQIQNPESRTVGKTQLGPYHISTVFLMINHGSGGKPQWFETMIWSEKTQEHIFFDYQTRYETYEEAIEGHETVVTMVREGILP